MKKPFQVICLCITASFLLLVCGVFIGRTVHFTDSPLSPLSDGTVSAGIADAGLVDINTASLEQLQMVPGIGEVLAERIIRYRQTNGPFSNITELANVEGIGLNTLNKLYSYVTVGG